MLMDTEVLKHCFNIIYAMFIWRFGCKSGHISQRHICCDTFPFMFPSINDSPLLTRVDDSLIKISLEVHVLYVNTCTVQLIQKYCAMMAYVQWHRHIQYEHCPHIQQTSFSTR